MWDNSWIYIHRAIRRRNCPINVEIQETENDKARFYFPTSTYIKKGCKNGYDFIEYEVYKNARVIQSMNIEKHKIRQILKGKYEIQFYSNYVIINGISFNGISKDYIDKVILEIEQERKEGNPYDVFEWE